MGCAASRINKEERVQVCKERKRLMKQLVGYRRDFAEAQMSYLRALKNTGVTLRQFTESDSLELEKIIHKVMMAPSPPPTLPPSPPPLPPLSPDNLGRHRSYRKKEINGEDGSIEMMDEHDRCSTPPMPPAKSGIIEYLYPFPSPHDRKATRVEQADEENWAETKSHFDDEEDEHEIVSLVDERNVKPDNQKVEPGETIDDGSSTTSWYAKGSEEEMPALGGRNKKTLELIVKELDDYFLKASGCEKEIAIFMDIGTEDTRQNFNGNRSKRSNSAKVFSALSWGWSSKSSQSTKDTTKGSPNEPCKPGAHCITLQKLYASEKKLYKEVKHEEATKKELAAKSMLLQKQEEEKQEWAKSEKTRLCVEDLEFNMRRLQDSISKECLSIQQLIDEELYPQLVALTSGLVHKWTTMHKCHQVQSQLSQALNHVSLCEDMDLSSESQRQAAAQLESEVASWYNSFCKLVKSQQQYVRTLCKWIRLTSVLVDGQQRNGCSMVLRKLCEHWKLELERLPDKVVAEAIHNFLTAIHSIILQQAAEQNLQRKLERQEKKLQKEFVLLTELEKKFGWGLTGDDAMIPLSAKHPLSLQRAKVEVMKEKVAAEKAKYQKSIQQGKNMTLTSLRKWLPTVFLALIEFTSACSQALEAIRSHVVADVCDTSQGGTSSPQTLEREHISESCERSP